MDETAKINSALFALAEHERQKTDDEESVQSRKVSNHNKLENNKQQRNKTAVIIKRRIKEKLEGRDPDASVRKSVADQASHLYLFADMI